jgi:hypothetical protein
MCPDGRNTHGLRNEVRAENKCNERNTQTYIRRRKPQSHLEERKRRNSMRMQEPEQWPLSEAAGTTNQEYSTSRAETWRNAPEQKIYPQEALESRISVLLSYLTIGFSSIGFGASVVGLVGSSIVLGHGDGSRNLLTGGILGLVGSIVALLLFGAIFVLSLVSEARRQARSQRSRSR